MLNKSINGASLAELLYSQVARMTPEQVAALRAELIRSLPAYISESVKRAVEMAEQERQAECKRG